MGKVPDSHCLLHVLISIEGLLQVILILPIGVSFS